ncbi:transposase [Desulforudis sp. DRI-14]|uniref:transposase n=1 Tax=Desulforudis sp. DRI-14 TaxID=3459793 RepID=UPI0040417A34
MGRRPRIEYEGAVYHVIQRGNNKEHIFADDLDKEYLLRQMDECRRSLGFRLFGYVVMGNHYHLLLKTERKPLNKIMHRINGNFARYFNMKHQRSGTCFSGTVQGDPSPGRTLSLRRPQVHSPQSRGGGDIAYRNRLCV